MLELTKKQTTPGVVELAVEVPEAQAERVMKAFAAILELIEEADKTGEDAVDEEDRLFTPEEVFGPRQPGRLIRAARTREGLTQKELARRIGVRPSNLSEMEHGKRPIGKEMARRLAAELRTSYKVFL